MPGIKIEPGRTPDLKYFSLKQSKLNHMQSGNELKSPGIVASDSWKEISTISRGLESKDYFNEFQYDSWTGISSFLFIYRYTQSFMETFFTWISLVYINLP